MKQRMRKLICAGLTLALTIAVFPSAKTSQGATTLWDTPSITDAEAADLVKASYEKYKAHDVVCYALDSGSDVCFYAYDIRNKVGVVACDIDNYKKTGFDYELNDWYDLNNRLLYESGYNEDNKLVYYMDTIYKGDVDDFENYFFKDILDAKEKGFPLGTEFHYDGNIVVYGPNKVQHICYRIVIPEIDESLYEEEEFYLPKQIYIGVDDGEIYRIDEERYSFVNREYTIHHYQTYFDYPESIAVPKTVEKNAILDPQFSVEKGDLFYSIGTSGYHKNKKVAFVWEYDYRTEKPKVKILDKISVLGKKYDVEEISYEAFYEAQTLKDVTFGKSILRVCYSAFSGCTKLKKVKFNGKLRRIDANAFHQCKSLTGLTLPNSVERIEKAAFSDCKKLKTITIGKKLKKIGANVFKGCKSLKTITVKNKKMKAYFDSAEGRAKLGIGKKVKIK